MSDRRRRLSVPILAVSILSLGVLPAAAEAPSDPVLWDGVLRSPDGRPAPGEVVAYVRPPAATLEPGDELAELARTRSDGSGRFVLRARPSPAVVAARDESGWVSVMLFAFSDQGLALATDSVAWKPTGNFRAQSADGAPGRWVTDPAGLFTPSEGRFRATAAGSPPETERPTTLVLGGQASNTISAMAAPPQGAGTCGVLRSKEVGIHPVAVGELHLRDAWGGFFEYTNTRSTSFQVGVSYGGGGWSVGGSDSMTATSTMAQGKTIPHADRDDAHLSTFKAELLFKQFDWRCSRNGYRWENVSTIQPVSWPNGGMREVAGGDHPRCGSNDKFFSTVIPNGYLRRQGKWSITLSGAFAVAGFTGGMTAAASRGVNYEWYNRYPAHRAVCGSTNQLDRDTRAATSGMR